MLLGLTKLVFLKKTFLQFLIGSKIEMIEEEVMAVAEIAEIEAVITTEKAVTAKIGMAKIETEITEVTEAIETLAQEAEIDKVKEAQVEGDNSLAFAKLLQNSKNSHFHT